VADTGRRKHRGSTWPLALASPCAGGARRARPLVQFVLSVALSLLVAAAALAGAATGRAAPVRLATTPALTYSRASNLVVQRQPAPGSCHAIGSGIYSRPDPHCTPGALNPQVTQATIGRTICKSGWTATVRPPESTTEREKRASMAAYGDRRPLSYYEYDHFVPLELGGATNDARNLWPEPGASPNPKDKVESALRRKVCDRQMTLAQAQRAIVTNWVLLAQPTKPAAPSPSTPKPPSKPAATCSASAQYNSRYDDYDVYVHSNQPDQAVTVTGSDGGSATWHTDSSGYADVYFHAGRSGAGETVTVRAGAANCSTSL